MLSHSNHRRQSNCLDFILSQVAEEMENEYKCEQDWNNLTISQCITSYFDDDDLNDLTFDVGYHFDTNMTESLTTCSIKNFFQRH
jgi:hypothetical protein